jgi:hypothetical protein
MRKPDITYHNRRWGNFLVKAKKIGFRVVPPSREARDVKRHELRQPKARRRVEELKNQVILEFELDGYVIRVLTSYDALKKSFTMAGRLSVLISPKVKKGKKPPKALLWRHFHRIYNFLDRGLLMMEFLVDRLQNRPVDSKGDLMELEFVQNYYYRWRSSSHRYDTEPFLRNLPNKFLTYGSEWFDDMRRYEKVIRPAKGIKKRAKDIRKPWTQAHPVHTMR